VTKRKEGAIKGRPSKYSEDLADEIAEKLSQGITLTSICSDPDMPTIRTIQNWAGDRPHFFALLVRAREAGTETLTGELHDRMTNMVRIEKRQTPVTKEEIDSLRLYAQHIQWLTSRWNPKRYSERVLAELAKLPEPVREEPTKVDYDYLTADERETMMNLMQIAKQRKEGELIEGEVIEVEGEIEYEPSEQSAGRDQSDRPAS
jgi:hypothetical protein